MNACEVCGVVGEKYNNHQKKEQVLEREKKKLEEQETKLMREALDRARYEEDERLREEARNRLGIQSVKLHPRVLAASLAGILVAGAGVSFAIYTYKQQDEGTDTAMTANAAEADKKAGGVNITLAPPPGVGNITVSGISDPMARPVVETDGLLPDEAGATPPASPTPATPAAVNLTASELEELKVYLHPPRSEEHFQQVTRQRYQHDADLVTKFLQDANYEQALGVIEANPDAYAATLLMLNFIQNQPVQEQLKTRILSALKQMAVKSEKTPQAALVQAGLGHAYRLFGDEPQADAILSTVLDTLVPVMSADATAPTDLPPIEVRNQHLRLLAQIAQDSKYFGSTATAQRIINQGKTLLDNLPTDQPLQCAQAFTRLASGYVVLEQYPQAQSWLERIDDSNARVQLVRYLDMLQSPQDVVLSVQ